MRTQELFDFIRERDAIWDRRRHNLPKPWTEDKILQRYRFCNVYREQDTETIWFAKHWRSPHFFDDYLWFASLVFRLVNWHATAQEIGYPIPWNEKNFKTVLSRIKSSGKKVYNNAYLITTHGTKGSKEGYIAKLLTRVWRQKERLQYRAGEDLKDFHDRLLKVPGLGSFMIGQVIADCKYAGSMRHAKDWWTFAVSGPGSKRGLNLVMERDINAHWNEKAWFDCLTVLDIEINKLVREAKMLKLHAQDLQNCLCEFSKYEKARLGIGRPKQRYNGGGENVHT